MRVKEKERWRERKKDLKGERVRKEYSKKELYGE